MIFVIYIDSINYIGYNLFRNKIQFFDYEITSHGQEEKFNEP